MEYKILVILIIIFSINLDHKIYSLNKVWIANLNINEAPTKVFSKYIDFADILLLKLAIKLSKYININRYTIKLVDDQQSLYCLIYSLRLVKLEILKVYIKINLSNKFIRPF